jgi:hypothetical protein
MNKALLRLISGLEVIGGVGGLVILAKQIPAFRVEINVILLAPIAIGIYLMSLVAGLLLLREHRAGRIASIIVQAIQLPKLVSPLLVFMFSFGFDFYPFIVVARGVSRVEAEFRLFAFYNLYLNRPEMPVAFGVSIPAIAFLIVLLRYKPGSTQEKPMPPLPPTSSEWGDSTDAVP